MLTPLLLWSQIAMATVTLGTTIKMGQLPTFHEYGLEVSQLTKLVERSITAFEPARALGAQFHDILEHLYKTIAVAKNISAVLNQAARNSNIPEVRTASRQKRFVIAGPLLAALTIGFMSITTLMGTGSTAAVFILINDHRMRQEAIASKVLKLEETHGFLDTFLTELGDRQRSLVEQLFGEVARHTTLKELIIV